MLLKFMLALGGASINLPVFNLNITCLSELSLFKNCLLPADMPELASESVVSIPCKVLSKEMQSEKIFVSWKKMMWKRHESLDIKVLTGQALMRAMLACKMLILIESKHGNKAFKIHESGRKLLDQVIPCKLETTRAKAWSASAMCLYVIFKWIKQTGLVQTAVDEFVSEHRETIRGAGYNLSKMKISSPEIIKIKLVSRRMSVIKNHLWQYDYERGGFSSPVDGIGMLVGTPTLMIMTMLCSVAHTYIYHNNSGNLDRHSLIPCMLYYLKMSPSSSALKKAPLNRIDNLLKEQLSTARTMNVTSLVVPLAVSDYRTPEGTHKNRKKKLACRIARPTENKTLSPL